MARERMVTRTVTVSNIEVMCLDVVTAEVQVKNVKVNGEFTEFDKALKSVKKVYETETFKCVSVMAITTEEVLYGMSELEFIRMAKVLPPRTSTTEE